MAQQIYAKIKRNSKYYGQGEPGQLFEVFVDAARQPGEYVVQGGPGGQYRMRDVNLFVENNNKLMRIC